MVTTSQHSDQGRNRDRGQLILIGAITLAFIILGVVVVFNGVLYTETLSSSATSQSASDAATTEAEVARGIGCLAENVNGDADVTNPSDEVETQVEKFSEMYRNTTANSEPAIRNVSLVDEPQTDGSNNVTQVNVTVQYSSNDVDYSTELQIEPENCPETE
ncbi:DUF7261 family protein [Halosolutus halophilus]|uniref:DUF7261 family protein n=1 Tax=Halosolutus halophilus TaxID=1552990 RepID=UPI00223510B6|nr:hypothetical protein [Halosolutus halophilus]